MNLIKLKMLTIICEPTLEKKMILLIKKFGAKGYSINELEGEGASKVTADDIHGRDLRIETIVSEEVSLRILQNLAENFFPKYSVLAFQTDVEVVRGEKYV